MPLPTNPGSIDEIERQTPGATALIQAMRTLGEDGVPQQAIYETPQRARAGEYLVALGLAEEIEDELIGGTRFRVNEAAVQALEN